MTKVFAHFISSLHPPKLSGSLLLALLSTLGVSSLHGQIGFSTPNPVNALAKTDSGRDQSVRATTLENGRDLIAVWESNDEMGGGFGTDFDLFAATSEDGGSTWSTPVSIVSDADSDQAQDIAPSLAMDASGNLMVVWKRMDSFTAGASVELLASHSTDNGRTWSIPSKIHSGGNLGTRPRVVADGRDRWHAVWHSDDSLSSTAFPDQDVFLARSDNNGESWSAPLALNRNADTDSSQEIQPTLASNGNGVIIAAWIFDDGSVTRPVIARSTNYGDSWSLDETLPGNDRSNDFTPDLTTDGNGVWLLTWESGNPLSNSIGDDQDILMVRSSDEGATWSSPTALNLTADKDEAMDSNFNMTTDGLGSWLAVWQSAADLNGAIGEDDDILVAYSVDHGSTWSHPFPLSASFASDTVESSDQMPTVIIDARGRFHVFWESENDGLSGLGRDGDVLHASVVRPFLWEQPSRHLNSNALADTASDFAPKIGAGENGTLIAVWMSNEDLNGTAGTDLDLFLSRSTDEGSSWSTVTLLNSNGEGDVGNDRDPSLVYLGSEKWAVLWSSTDDLGGTIGTDQDLLIASSSDDGINWTTPTAVNNNARTDTEGDFSPRLLALPSGDWVTVWISDNPLGDTVGMDNDVFLAVSKDAGASWTDPAALNSNASTDTGEDFDPIIAAGAAGRWIAAWMSNDTLGGTVGDDDDIFYAHSDDQGGTWSFPVPLNANAATDGPEEDDFFPSLAADSLGNWLAAWHSEGTLGDTVGKDFDIHRSVSHDNASSWSTVATLNQPADTDTGDDVFVRVSHDGSGTWLAVWTSQESLLGGFPGFGADSEVAYAFSRDAGDTWSPSSALSPLAARNESSAFSPFAVAQSSTSWGVVWSERPDLLGADADLRFARAMPTEAPLLSTSERNLPARCTIGLPGEVSISIKPESGTLAYAVSETLPLGWSIRDISDGGTIDPWEQIIRWGPFYDDKSRLLTYTATPTASAVEGPFAGTASFAGRSTRTTGDLSCQLMTPTAPTIARAPTGDRVVEGHSASLCVVANDQGTLTYQWAKDGLTISGATQPCLNLPAVAPGDTGHYTVSVANDQGGTVTTAPVYLDVRSPAGLGLRDLPEACRPGVDFTVTLRIEPIAGIAAYAIEDKVPVGWTINSVDADGKVAPSGDIVRWGPIFGDTAQTFTYEVTPTAVAGTFEGEVSFNGVSQKLEGDAVCPQSKSTGTTLRTLSGDCVIGQISRVSLTVRPEAGVLAYAVEEIPPIGWSIDKITEGGTLDPRSGEIRWGPFFDDSERNLSYDVIPAAGGSAAFRGTASFDGLSVVVSGDANCVPVTPPLPIILNAPQGQSVLEGNGATFCVDANGIGTLSYQWIKNGTAIPGATESCLALTSVGLGDAGSYAVRVDDDQGGDLTTVAVRLEVLAPLGKGERDLPDTCLPEVAITVALTIEPNAGAVAYSVEDRVPAGWRISSAGNEGVIIPGGEIVRWGPFIDQTMRTLTYEAIPTSGGESFSGSVSFNGLSQDLGGDTSCPLAAISGSAIRTLPGECVIGQSGQVSLRVQPEAGVSAYAIEDIPPPGWLLDSLSDGGTLDTSSGAIRWGPFFDNTERTLTYRVIPVAGEPAMFSGRVAFDGQVLPVEGDSVCNPQEPDPLVLNTVPQSARLAAGEDHTLSVVATGPGAFSYQWFKDGIAIPDEDQSCLALANLGRSDGGNYRVEVKDTLGRLASASASLIVVDPELQFERIVAPKFQPGSTIPVELSLLPLVSSTAIAIEEYLPPGWTASDIEENGRWDQNAGRILWGPFLDGQAKNLGYHATSPPNAKTDATFSARISVSGVSFTRESLINIDCLRIEPVAGALLIHFCGDGLWSTDSLEEPFTRVESATSPWRVIPSASARFYSTR